MAEDGGGSSRWLKFTRLYRRFGPMYLLIQTLDKLGLPLGGLLTTLKEKDRAAVPRTRPAMPEHNVVATASEPRAREPFVAPAIEDLGGLTALTLLGGSL